jgi:hypothetical protein
LSGKYNIDEIEAKNGSFNMRVDRKGLVNWDVWKADTSSTPNEKFKINLEDIAGENISYLYEDEQEKTFIDVKLKELKATGNFNEKQFLSPFFKSKSFTHHSAHHFCLSDHWFRADGHLQQCDRGYPY